MDPTRAQAALRRQRLGGWLLYTFGQSNPIALELLGLQTHLSRRLAYLIPAQGDPLLIIHAIEASTVQLPGRRQLYSRWEDFVRLLAEEVTPLGRIAMEYQPGGGIPYLSRLDGGTLELFRGLGIEVVSSAELLLEFQTWDAPTLAAHLRAVAGVQAARDAGLSYLRQHLGDPPSEFELQDLLARVLHEQGLLYDSPPMVGYGSHAANPHHQPDASRLRPGEVVLLDIWARTPEGPYADITWMAGWNVAPEIHRAFEDVRRARDAALSVIAQTPQVRGYEVDRAARRVLEEAGWGPYILHRTGHSLGIQSPHGHATHLDDLESHDTRPLLPGLAFTIEPGIYPGPWGLRSEIDVVLGQDGPQVTTDAQVTLEELG
jgi:Xaa-Pro dipeptidase